MQNVITVTILLTVVTVVIVLSALNHLLNPIIIKYINFLVQILYRWRIKNRTKENTDCDEKKSYTIKKGRWKNEEKNAFQ